MFPFPATILCSIPYMMSVNMGNLWTGSPPCVQPVLHLPSHPHRSMSIASSPHPASLVAGVYAAWSMEQFKPSGKPCISVVRVLRPLDHSTMRVPSVRSTANAALWLYTAVIKSLDPRGGANVPRGMAVVALTVSGSYGLRGTIARTTVIFILCLMYSTTEFMPGTNNIVKVTASQKQKINKNHTFATLSDFPVWCSNNTVL